MKHRRLSDRAPSGCLWYVAALVIVLLAGLVGRMDHEEAQRQETECQTMLALWEETDGEQGWPHCGG